jgi:glycosyltransferase involved in cell wall biosynthesis
MRIAQINDIASVASELTRGLRARGHDVTLMQPPLRGARLHPLVKPLVGPARAMEWVDLLRKIHDGRFELAHIHYAYLGNVGALGNVPYILHCHGTDLRESTPFTRPLIRNALLRARHVFYSTPDLARYVHAVRPDGEFLPNPIDTSVFTIERAPSEARNVFICCGLTEVKGVERIYNACRRLAEQRPDIRLTAVSGGKFASEFAALGNVTLIPRQRRSNLPAIINRHAVVLGQARLGAIGMAELEAMACGRPVVTWFNQPHVYEVEPPCIRAVDGYDLAQAVAQLVDDPSLRDSLGVAARAWVGRFHGIDEVVDRVEAVSYREINRSRNRTRLVESVG